MEVTVAPKPHEAIQAKSYQIAALSEEAERKALRSPSPCFYDSEMRKQASETQLPAQALNDWIVRSGLDTQRKAARKLGISEPLLSRLLTGSQKSVSRSTALRLRDRAAIPLSVFGYADVATPRRRSA